MQIEQLFSSNILAKKALSHEKGVRRILMKLTTGHFYFSGSHQQNKKKTCTLRLKREKGPTKHNVDELKIFYSKE